MYGFLTMPQKISPLVEETETEDTRVEKIHELWVSPFQRAISITIFVNSSVSELDDIIIINDIHLYSIPPTITPGKLYSGSMHLEKQYQDKIFRGTKPKVLAVDGRAELLAHWHMSRLSKSLIRPLVSFGTKNIFANIKKLLWLGYQLNTILVK